MLRKDSPLETMSPLMLGFLGSLAAGAMTAVGAVPVLFGRTPSRATRDLSLGFAAGVMLAASFFSLIIPALEAAGLRYDSEATPAAIVCLAILLGMGAVALMNELLPHEHFKTGREGPAAASGAPPASSPSSVPKSSQSSPSSDMLVVRRARCRSSRAKS